ncbi:hypothetical protein HBB16_21630 [Pseudonocardia sp. MCCB 268]|nr:hypothetical protein [Pseudonocardia cytotoxica]
MLTSRELAVLVRDLAHHHGGRQRSVRPAARRGGRRGTGRRAGRAHRRHPLDTGTTSLTWDELLAGGEPMLTGADLVGVAGAGSTSGTGKPKGAMHRHSDIRYVCETTAGPRHPRRRRLCLSVAKLFFAYGIGNSMFFRCRWSACAVLRRPPGPGPVLGAWRPSTAPRCSSPSPATGADAGRGLREQFGTVRRGVSAGEALPARMFRRARALRLRGARPASAPHRGPAHLHLEPRCGEVVPGSSSSVPRLRGGAAPPRTAA